MPFGIRAPSRLAFALLLLAGVAASEYASAEGADLFAPSREAGQTMDAARALPASPFYDVSPDGAAAGTLVRAEAFSGYALPPGVTSIRVLYHTRTADERDAIASAVVLLPYGEPPKDGWPLIAWSHGTSGVARACAPSLMKSLFYNWEGLYEYVSLGYAVVATDYVVLGTAGRHAYLDMESNGADVVFSVPAARAAVPQLGRKWIAVGHSQGGLSVLGVAQIEGRIRDPNFLGTVSLSGASDLEDAIDSATAVNQPILNGLMAFIVFGVKTLYSEFDPRDILTEDALAIYNTRVEKGCSAASGAFTSVPTARMFKPGWKGNPYVKRLLERDRPGARPIYGPVFLVGGGSDVMFTESAGTRVFQRLCASGAMVRRSVYPGLGHDAVVYGSLKDQVAWIASRFAGDPAPSDCAARTTSSWLSEALADNPWGF
jgi:acetyl esterase/lipase